MSNVVDFKADNKEQVFKEADYIRNRVSVFNRNSPEYKISKLVLGTSKVNGLYVGEDTVFVSFSKEGDLSYKDNGAVTAGKCEADIESLRVSAAKVFEEVKPMLEHITQSKILKFAPIVELETSKNFKKGLTREIYNKKSFLHLAPLKDSLNVQNDFFTQQELEFKIQKLKERTTSGSSMKFK